MNNLIKKIFNKKFYLINYKKYKDEISKDERANANFRHGDNGKTKLSLKEKRTIEFRTVKLYRKFQVNQESIWGYYYKWRLKKWARKTGIDFLNNRNIGSGLVIGHWGRIIVNGNAKLGNEIMITHGVTIGRNVNGKRKGVPTIGDRVCIRANSTVTGNIIIGNDVLIAPNTFVNFYVPDHSIVIGNPAIIHHRDNATFGHVGRY